MLASGMAAVERTDEEPRPEESGVTRQTHSGPPETPEEAFAPTEDKLTLVTDRYRILRRIGKGGMGEVFLAEHTAIGKLVAIKLLSEELARKPRTVQRFLQEARAASLIGHENVVDITDFGHTPSGLPYLTMEFLVGEDLKHTLRREGRLAWPRTRRILLQLLAALGAAHRMGVVHRDIKPDNCFRVQRGDNPDFIKVLDFGIAKVTGEDTDQNLTQTGVVMGTAEYMSPEQAKSEPIDARTDLYAVGVILYQMLTGRVPFRATGFMGTLSKHITEPVPPPRTVAPEAEIGRALEQVMLKALAKAPDERFQSAEAFAEALRALPPNEGEAKAPPRSRAPMVVAVTLAVAAVAFALGPRVAGMFERTGPEGQVGASAGAATAGAATAGEGSAGAATAGEVAATAGAGSAGAATAGEVAATAGEGSAGATTAGEVGATAGAATAGEVGATTAGEVGATGTAGETPPPVDTKASPSKPKPKPKPTPAPLPERLSAAALRAGFAAVEATARECRKHGGLPGTVVHVQLTVTAEGKVEGATAKKPYAGTSLGRCVEAAARTATFPRAQEGQRAEPGFKL
jgi:serine/threonine-protein kinase